MIEYFCTVKTSIYINFIQKMVSNVNDIDDYKLKLISTQLFILSVFTVQCPRSGHDRRGWRVYASDGIWMDKRYRVRTVPEMGTPISIYLNTIPLNQPCIHIVYIYIYVIILYFFFHLPKF